MGEKDTTKLNRTDLKYLLIDSLKQYSEDTAYLSGDNPYAFNINKKVMHIFIHNVHATGRGRTNPDECRIQINRTRNFLEAEKSGKPVLFFGYYPDDDVFTAWDPSAQTERINRREVVSVYSRFSVQKKASENGIACYTDNNDQVIISFRPEFLGLYLENFDSMHLSNEKTLLELIKESDKIQETEEDIGSEFEIERKKFKVTHKRFKREVGFRNILSKTYRDRCAICGIQLDLVEAAHIIPHAHERGTDHPTNGICLCALHHKAFDNGLIYIDDDYNVKINRLKLDYLEKVHKDGGYSKFIELHYEKLNLPNSKVYYPSKEFIKIANKIRGIHK